jgi:superfamily I DNA and/or RNA helicase
MEVVGGGAPGDLTEQQVRACWQLLFLFVPVVSTTFASLDRLFAGLGSQALGWLFVDEAGQAAPQQVTGALWRAQRAIIVGDPLQLEPVVTVPWTVQQRLRNHFGVAREWSPGTTSVQRVADRLARHGTTLPAGGGEPVWVGSPLRVHRRCDRLMFDVSNAIAYDEMMVFGTPGDRDPYAAVTRSVWLDVIGTEAQGKWIPEEGRALTRTLDVLESRLREQLHNELAAAAGGQVPDWAGSGIDPARAVQAELFRRMSREVFIVSPFREVATAVNALTRKRLDPRRVGTVHTTQGKEANVVVLVLGTSPEQSGARTWASEAPNLLNVAVSRARRRLIVIGNRTAWSGHRYFSTLAAHPDLPTVAHSSWQPQVSPSS